MKFCLFKSIFSKLFTATFLTILITILIIGALLFTMLGNYAASQKEVLFKDYTQKINEMTEYVYNNYNSKSQYLYSIFIKSLSANSGSVIIIVDETGEIIASSRPQIMASIKKLKKELYYDVIMGKTIKKTGNFEGIFEQDVLTYGMPLLINGKISGAIFFNSPLPEIFKLRFEIFILFLLSTLAATIIAFFITFFLSKKISNPIKEINNAAKSLANGKFDNRVLVNSTDEIGELSKTFNQMSESLQNLEDMRRTFIADVSHELRTPMTTIKGFLEGILDNTIPKEKQKEYLETVILEVKRLSRLTNDLLDIAKLEAGSVKLQIKPFEINELIRIALIGFENKINEKNININVNFADDSIFVLGDSDSIQRVITNLLDNAIKFTNQDGYVNINVYYENNKVLVSVENSGYGISEEEISYIWDRFYKTDKSRSLDKSGVGLGLFIVKNILNLHNQKIWVESLENNYSKFTFSLEKA